MAALLFLCPQDRGLRARYIPDCRDFRFDQVARRQSTLSLRLTTASQDRSCDGYEVDLSDFQPDPISCLAGHEQTLCPGGELFWKRATDDLSPNLLDLSDAILLCHRGDSAHLSTNSTMSDASTPNFSFNHLILFSRYSCAWGNLPGTIRALRTKVTDIGTPSYWVFSTKHKFIVLWEAH